MAHSLVKSAAPYLGGFCLASAGRSGRSPSKAEVESPGECEVAAVSERGDDQTTRVTQVLVTVEELGIDGPDVQVLLNPVVPAGGNTRCYRGYRTDNLLLQMEGCALNTFTY